MKLESAELPVAEQPAERAMPTGSAGPSPIAGVVDAFREMFHEIIQYRELLWQMVLRDVRIRYKQAVMGFGWAIFMPIMVVASGFLVKYAMARIAGDSIDSLSISGMSVKAMGWAFFVGAVGFGVNSLTTNINLVTKIYFPREVFPLSAVITQIFDSLIGTVVVAGILFGPVRIALSWNVLWVIPLVLLLSLLTAATCLFLSCVNVFFRDVKYLVQVIITFGIFFTPVFYDAYFFGPTGCKLMMLNPLSPLLEGLRLAVVSHHNLLYYQYVGDPAAGALAWSPWFLAYAAAWSIFGFLGAWWLFHKLEFVFAEYI